LVYKTVAGLQENVKGVGLRDTLNAFEHIDWPGTLIRSARSSLWTGNESHEAFSRNTLDIEIGLLVIGLSLLFFKHRRLTVSECWILGGIGVFILALLYDLCVAWADTHGLQNATGPYYAPCILPPIYALVFLGLQRNGRLGRILAALVVLMSAWIAAVTYVAKFVPFYGGYLGRSTLPALWKWWSGNPAGALTDLALAPLPIVWLLLGLFLATLIAVTWIVLAGLRAPRQVPRQRGPLFSDVRECRKSC
jgi:hypothetical protein